MNRRVVVGDDQQGARLDVVLAALLALSRTEVAKLIDADAVRMPDGAPAGPRSRRVAAGEILEVSVPKLGEQATDSFAAAPQARVVYEDEHLFVFAKPAGLVVHPAAAHRGPTLVDQLRALPDPPTGGDPERPGIVHRLDKDTSGLLIVARTSGAYDALTEMIARREITRIYDALLDGVLEHDATVDAPIGRDPRRRTRMGVIAEGRDAVTTFTRTETYPRVTLVRAQLETGRTHQIRVHASAIGHPVAGDATYGADPAIARDLGLERPFLHAAHLRFVHPATGDALVLDEALPDDLAMVLARLRGAVRIEDPRPPHHR